jgi:hypothetical protein
MSNEDCLRHFDLHLAKPFSLRFAILDLAFCNELYIMFIIELTLKNSPIPLSVQRKSAEEADATYKEIAESMRSPDRKETCSSQRQHCCGVGL